MARKSGKQGEDVSLKESGHSFEDYFKRAVNPMLVLHLLSEQPMYVYQMTQELKYRGGNDCAVSFLYPVLYRLQKLGYVEESGKEISDDNRVRNYYTITTAGRSHLSELKEQYRLLLETVDSILADSLPDAGKGETEG